ncbi:xanthine dehydrogenase family protein subunit M [Thermobifida fusca]|jgi:carbon-monoxide dehydrogenase medium subunit|uniref:Molybdopterin dehydrogenase n=2 Tax=Thermobifida fusca TaxID=2021 RepID=A0A9P2WQ09_THEFU|nr:MULTISPECIES: xanthine dehydrogenase family protein subunit M [Thermobifida]AAZ56620.1 molybdopterin dehydrogenase [Thermobifida fusca YX]EOR70321.1 molybdopterin dehydrogenase [Thermobifida fusca TM51]MBO2528462.1 xanthine dehydrogenase family protein subunit M [Thermobifida sp.]PPS93312.1 carbon monoxide dehydrogenase [Thermobifida fusca]PZN63670.1 MAG: xanthine dehydrogenase family protein subunit M [Thermobifida fusca]
MSGDNGVLPPGCEYARAHSIAEAVQILGESLEGRVLAGGQSLVPLLRSHQVCPDVLVDLGGVAELRGVRDEGDSLWIGALTTYHEVASHPLVRSHAPLLARVAGVIADPAVRHRGTVGGALAYADPAFELPTAAVALGAECRITGPAGERGVPAAHFFVAKRTTAIGPDELVTGIRVPKWPGWSFHYERFPTDRRSWAIGGAAAGVRRGDGVIAAARVVLGNVGPTPLRAATVEAACIGLPSRAALLRAAARAVDEVLPSDSASGDVEHRGLARVLTGRALITAAGV